MSFAIETRDLSRVFETYKKPDGLWNSIKGFWQRQYISKVALAPTTLNIEGGQIVGLVGANGAGKTTLIKLLCGLVHPTSGEARVLGYNPWERNRDYLRRMSVLLGQKNQLWWDLPPADSFDLLARIYDLDREATRKWALELADLLQCTEMLQIQLRRLSLGERMKMEIIGALLHKPEVLFLDEPTIGLDIVAQNTIREFLADYVRELKPTIILTSHYMDDISRLAKRLLLISMGQIVYDGTVDDFTRKAETSHKVTLQLAEPLAHSLMVGDREFTTGQSVVDFEIPSRDVGAQLSKVLSQVAARDIKIEATDFEDVIHKFLQKDSRHRAARNTHSV